MVDYQPHKTEGWTEGWTGTGSEDSDNSTVSNLSIGLARRLQFVGIRAMGGLPTLAL